MVFLLLAVLVTAGCSVSRFIPEDEHLLNNMHIRSTDKAVSTNQMRGYVQQHPNSRWFSLLKVPMGPYLMSGRDSTRRINRFLQRIGEAPVIYDRSKAFKTRDNIEAAVRNMGYLQASVDLLERQKGFKMNVIYKIDPGKRYIVKELEEHVGDTAIARLMEGARRESRLSVGMPFDLNELEAERTRLNRLMRNHGYYLFNKEFIRFEADTTLGNRGVALSLIVDDYRTGTQTERQPHRRFHVGEVRMASDSTNRNYIRKNMLRVKTAIEPGELYNEQHVQETYSNLSALGAVMNSSVTMTPDEEDSTRLNATVAVRSNKRHALNAELEGTNSSGDFGAAAVLSYQNRNLFRGSELLNVRLRGAFEAIRGLEGYDNQNYIEYGVETSLAFPDFKLPWLSRAFRRSSNATSEVSIMYGSQNRPEFHRRVVTGAWRYRWSQMNRQRQHRFDLLDLNYVFMPWISKTFREDYLDNASSRNAILRYNYEDLFIMKWGYTLSYTSQPLTGATGSYGTNAYSIRFSAESAGNLLYGFTSLFHTNRNSLNQYTLLNIAYAQYIKGDFDFAKSFRFSADNSLSVHFGLGIAYPYGNSRILPYEKRYFSGGANSVRGWSVRGLGPGRFRGTDGRIDFINQTGDIKLDMNLEYRSHLFWKIDGAVYIDAGNIWTIRDYADQPGGQFRFESFWRQIAVSYGLGIRLNFNYFILRLDSGMKAINPAYTDRRHHYPIIHPRFRRDFALHFAVGLPF
ncbi:MAG: BamA/TamA family outer membrane protein [Bacteroidaceae bacterium]|nr:BamA/TamA family outer membrane protein [Bacteroidaceae bacterium]MBR1789487.1 BamA/TamA family outer membrane protein [Bacteroidaceae bacterium]